MSSLSEARNSLTASSRPATADSRLTSGLSFCLIKYASGVRTPMARLLYGVSPIGLGHATRAVAIGELLSKAGVEILFLTGGPAAKCLRDSGFKVEDVVSEPVPKVKNGEMKNALWWYIAYWRGYRRTRKEVQGVMSRTKPDAVVGDEEFSSVSLALESRLPHALVSDELELGFARTWLARKVEQRVSEWYTELQSRVNLLIIPDAGQDIGNKRHVGPVVRRATKTRAQVFDEIGIPHDRKLVVVALSGSGIGDSLVEGSISALRKIPEANLVLMGNRGDKVTGEMVYDVGVVRDGQNLVAASDIVVSTAGKSTIDEAASFGTPLVAIPIGNHSEQLRNGAALGYNPSDLARLPELIASKIGRRQKPQEFQGAQKAAGLILSLLPS
jgi:UDP-N-acetylglucosamine--N-acetylmuramyl-(pentapeptide) pyrophosphoryl-undecaprenol N-acetylglucosamine transferase